MVFLPYIIISVIWLLSVNTIGIFAYVDAVLITIIVFGIYAPYAISLWVLFLLGLVSDTIYDTAMGLHGIIYMMASVLWRFDIYQRYAKYEWGYYLILTGAIFASQIVFGIERYISIWDLGIMWQYMIKGLFSAGLAVIIDMFIPQTIKQKVHYR